jgi:hypothetical protein
MTHYTEGPKSNTHFAREKTPHLGSLNHHLGHPRVTVARQSDWTPFALGINLPNLLPSHAEESLLVTAHSNSSDP